MSVLRYEVTDRVARLTLFRPEVRNALSSELKDALAASMATAGADDEVDVVVLTGADPAFCAGLDLRELGSTGANLLAIGERSAPWQEIAKPIIGAVNGVAVTGGLEVALHCDFLVASERAKFGDTHARVGVLPGWGLSVLLPQRIGLAHALEMSLTGNFLAAEEALAVGLVNHVVAHDDLLPFAHRLAVDIVGNDAATARELLRSYRHIPRSCATTSDGLQAESDAARAWKEHFDPREVERRRSRIVERGREQ